MFKKASKILLTVVGLVISFWAASSALAQWTEPTANPPLNNINQPVKQWDIWASDFGVDPDDDGNIDVYVPDASNAEIQIKSGTSPYWAIYQDDPTNQLRVWSSASDNLLSLTQDGKIGVNTDTPLYELTVYNPSSDVIIGMHPQGNTVPGVVGRYQENSNTSSGNSYFTYIANGGYHDPGLGESQFYGRNQYVNVQALTLNNDHGFRFLFGDPTINGESVAMTEVMRVQSNGRVGINNSNPTQELDVTGDIVASGTVCDVNGCIGEGTDSGGGWIDEGATVRLITASDNVGIGTVTPNQKLDVDGEIEFGDDQNWPGRLANVDTISEGGSARDDVLIGSYGGFILKADMNSNGTGATPALQVTDNTAELFRINENGYVGMGISSPNRNLHIYQVSGNNAEIDIQSVSGDGNHWGIYNDRTTNSLRLWGGSDMITVLRSGNVGIGTSAPADPLHVIGDIRGNFVQYDGTNCASGQILKKDLFSNWVCDTDVGSASGDNLGNHIATQNIRLNNNWLSNDGGNEGVYVTTVGNVGIGTNSPFDRLHVNGNLLFRGDDAGDIVIQNTDGTQKARIWGGVGAGINKLHLSSNDNTPDLTVNESGYVGIGTEIPAFPLHIEAGGANANLKFGVNAGNQGQIISRQTGSSGNYTNFAVTANDIILRTASTDGGTGSSDRLVVKHTTGNVGIGITGPTEKLDVSGNIRATGIICDSVGCIGSGDGGGGENLAATLALGADASSFTSQTTIGGILLNAGGVSGKLTVSTIDPVYTIDGQQYATYVSGMTGVKEETTGNIYLEKVNDTLAQAVIDFDEEAIGSDLWLFAQASNLPENFDTLVPVLTPGFDGSVWYEKNAAANQLIIYARAHGESLSDTLEVSYRLTAPRFDYEEWSNYSTDGIEGLNIDAWKAAR